MSDLESAPVRSKSAESSKTATDKKNAHLRENKAGEMFPQWSCLSCETINLLMELSVDQVQLQFVDVLNLKKHDTCMKEASLLDYFVAGFWWAKKMNFTCQQISFIMALLQLLLDNIKDKHMPFADNFKEFAKTLLATGPSSPSSSTTVTPLFDVDQIKSITDYFTSSLFQHYRLYEFFFTHPRNDMLLRLERNIEVVNSADFISPLEDGMPTDDLHPKAPSPAVLSDQDPDTCVERIEEVPVSYEQEETLESLESFSVEDVQEVLEEMTREMLLELQADFTEKLNTQEKTYTARFERLKRLMPK